ncbi:MAG: hypothetical protein M3454_07840 [Actinomycetota bacterium]|nr:hypothetical protein [Actinomycetota bacterium]
MDQFTDGLGDAFASIATFVPKLIGFLLILVIGYFIAKAVAKILDKVLERVGFDKVVERGGVGKALEKSQYDASSILGKIVFYTLFLFVLQLAFSVFGPNPISELITGVIAYLPNVFVAIVIVVIGAAIAAAFKEVIEASLGGLSYGKALAVGVSAMILSIAVFAALDQLNIAENIVIGLFYAVLAIIVGSSVVAIGGGGIQTMSRYWERASQKAEQESSNLKEEASGSKERIQERAQERKDQATGTGRTESSGTTQTYSPPDRPA